MTARPTAPMSAFVAALSLGLVCACGRNLPFRPTSLQPCPPCSQYSFTVDFPYDFSPDESLVVYGHADYGVDSSGVYLVGTSPGSIPRYVMPLPSPYWSPSALRFSPDGRRLVFLRNFADLFVLDLETRQERRITFTGGNASDGDWDPSGRHVIYSRPFLASGAPDSSAGLHMVDTETLSDRALLHDGLPTYGGDPKWSPDSSSIVFWYGTRLGPGERPAMALHLYALGVDGSGYRDLTPASTNDYGYPHWIRGGKEIIYEKYSGTNHNIHMTSVMDVVTAAQRDWPIDLLFPRSVISRNGTLVVFSASDPAGTFGVLHIQNATDVAGATRRQLTFVSQPVAP